MVPHLKVTKNRPQKLFTILESRRGDHELRTPVRPSKLAPVGVKIRQNAFRTIRNFRFFDADFFFPKTKFGSFSLFHDFRQILEELGIFCHKKSGSLRYFASDGQILRWVRRLELIIRDVFAKQDSVSSPRKTLCLRPERHCVFAQKGIVSSPRKTLCHRPDRHCVFARKDIVSSPTQTLCLRTRTNCVFAQKDNAPFRSNRVIAYPQAHLVSY